MVNLWIYELWLSLIGATAHNLKIFHDSSTQKMTKCTQSHDFFVNDVYKEGQGVINFFYLIWRF